MRGADRSTGLRIAHLVAGALILSGCATSPVALEGIAEARKLGAAVRGDGFEVWIDGLSDWPRELVGRRVRVTGVLEERNDLPVFVQKPGEPVAAGMPVAEGSDLQQASRRYVLRNATWSPIP